MSVRVIPLWADWPVGTISFFLSQLPGLFQFSVSFFEYFLGSTVQLVGWCHITNGAVKPDAVVVFDVLFYYSPSIVKRKRDARTDALCLYRLVKSLQLAV